nr:hypothetical protein [Burkholderia stagnalis]
MVDHEGSTGDISAFGAGRGGASGGTVSHAASAEATAIDTSIKLPSGLTIIRTFMPSLNEFQKSQIAPI